VPSPKQKKALRTCMSDHTSHMHQNTSLGPPHGKRDKAFADHALQVQMRPLWQCRAPGKRHGTAPAAVVDERMFRRQDIGLELND